MPDSFLHMSDPNRPYPPISARPATPLVPGPTPDPGLESRKAQRTLAAAAKTSLREQAFSKPLTTVTAPEIFPLPLFAPQPVPPTFSLLTPNPPQHSDDAPASSLRHETMVNEMLPKTSLAVRLEALHKSRQKNPSQARSSAPIKSEELPPEPKLRLPVFAQSIESTTINPSVNSEHRPSLPASKLLPLTPATSPSTPPQSAPSLLTPPTFFQLNPGENFVVAYGQFLSRRLLAPLRLLFHNALPLLGAFVHLLLPAVLAWLGWQSTPALQELILSGGPILMPLKLLWFYLSISFSWTCVCMGTEILFKHFFSKTSESKNLRTKARLHPGDYSRP